MVVTHAQVAVYKMIFFFPHKVQMVLAKMNLKLILSVYSDISTLNVKDAYIVNNQQLRCATYSYKHQIMTMNNIATSSGLRKKFKNVIKTFNFNVSGTNGDVAPKQRPDKFSSVGKQNHITTTFEHVQATPRDTVIGGSQKSKQWY